MITIPQLLLTVWPTIIVGVILRNVHVSIIGSTIIVIISNYYHGNYINNVKNVFQYFYNQIVAPTLIEQQF